MANSSRQARNGATVEIPPPKMWIVTVDTEDILVSFGRRRYVDALVPLYDLRMESSDR